LPLDIKIASYLDVKVPFQDSREEKNGHTNKSGQHIKRVKPKSHTHKGRRKHKMEIKGMIKM